MLRWDWIDMVPWKGWAYLQLYSTSIFLTFSNCFVSISHFSKFNLDLWMLDKILNFSLSNTVLVFPLLSSENKVEIDWLCYRLMRYWFYPILFGWSPFGWSQIRMTTLQNCFFWCFVGFWLYSFNFRWFFFCKWIAVYWINHSWNKSFWII